MEVEAQAELKRLRLELSLLKTIVNKRSVLQSPDGALWDITIDNAGTITAIKR